MATSTNGPETSCLDGTANGCWGDYIRVRSFNGDGNVWVASGYTLQGGRSGSNVVPRYVIFGRDRDIGHPSQQGNQYYSSSGDVSTSGSAY